MEGLWSECRHAIPGARAACRSEGAPRGDIAARPADAGQGLPLPAVARVRGGRGLARGGRMTSIAGVAYAFAEEARSVAELGAAGLQLGDRARLLRERVGD